MQNDRFQEKRYGNWLKVSLSLVYMKESLEGFTDEEMKNLHSSIQTNLLQKGCLLIPPGSLCQRCSPTNIKSIGNGPRKKWEIRPPCRIKLCNKWLDMIIAQHDHKPCPNVFWENTDPQLWPVNPWELAKVYLPYGCADQQSSTDADAAALLTLMMNCIHFHPLIQHRQMLQRVKAIRNRTMHTNDMLVEDQDMIAGITDILQLLRDPIHVCKLLPCQEAVNKIEQLRDNKIDLSLNRELELKALMQRMTTIGTDILTIKKVQHSLSDDVDALKTECGSLKQKLEKQDEIEISMKKITKDIEDFQDFMRTTGSESDLTRNALQKHATDILAISKTISRHDTTLKKHDVCVRKYANILKRHKKDLLQLKTKQSIQHFQHTLLNQEQLKHKTEHVKYDDKFKRIETKQSTLEAEQWRIDITQAEHTAEIGAIKSELGADKNTFDLKKTQEDLCELFRTDHRAQSTISPYDPDDVIDIEDIYTELYLIDLPKINDNPKSEKSDKDGKADEWRARIQSAFYLHELRYKEGKKIDNLDDMFVDGEKEFKRVVVQGDAGCGKTTWCNKIVQDWVKINDKKSIYQGTDHPGRNKPRGKLISKFSLLFPLSLSGLSANYNFEQTLKEHVFGTDTNIGLKGLKEYVFDNPSEVLFLLDGYDECNVTGGFVNDLIEHKVSGLHEAWVIVTSRPWKVESLACRKHINRIIEVRGFDETSIPLYIKRYMETTEKSNTEKSMLCKFLIKRVNQSDMYHLAKIPMLLNMICHLYEKGQLEAETYTGMYMCMLEIYKKRFETKGNLYNLQEQRTDSLIAQLGEFAWQTLISADPEENSLLFDASKVVNYISEECLKVCQNIGLISKSRTFSSRSRIVTMSFPHRSMHEFLSAKYLSESGHGNDEVNRYVRSVFVGDRDVYKIANTLLFVCGLSRNVGISMLNQLKDHSCITGVQLSTNFLLCCCSEIYNKNKEQTNLILEGIKTLSFTKFGKLEQSLVDLCKTSIETVHAVQTVDSEVQINLNDLNLLSVLLLENCEIQIQPLLSNSLKHVVLNGVFMSPLTWRMFFRQLSRCHYLTSLQIYFCVDKSIDPRQTHGKKITVPSADDDVNYLCIEYSSFTSTKFIFPKNEHITECRLHESHFRTEHSDIEESVQNLHSLKTLHIEYCSLDNIRIPEIDTLKTLNIKCKQNETEINGFLESINKCKALSSINCQVQKQYVFALTSFQAPTIQSSVFRITDGIFKTPIRFPSAIKTEKLEISNASVECNILSTTNLLSNLLEIDLVNCAFDVSLLRFPDESNIKTIKITSTTMTVEGCSSIFESIGRMQHLAYCKFDRVTIGKQDGEDLYQKYNMYEPSFINGKYSKLALIQCDFGTASVRLPDLAMEYDLHIDSVKMNGDSWKCLLQENKNNNLRSILIKTCNVQKCEFHFVNDEIETFVLCNAVLSQHVCESMFKMLGKQNKISICNISNVSVGRDNNIEGQYQYRSAHGYVIEKCNFGQSNVLLTSFGKAKSLTIESVHMSDASWEHLFKHAKSETLKEITIQANKRINIRLSIPGLRSLEHVSGTNLQYECLDLAQSVKYLCFEDCVFDCKIRFPALCEQINLINVHFGKTDDLQATIDSIDKVEGKLRIYIKSMNLKDVRFQIRSFSHSVTLDTVDFSDSNQHLQLHANEINASDLCVINTDIHTKMLLIESLERITFEGNTLPEVHDVFSKCMSNFQTIHTISFQNCDLSSFNKETMLPKLTSLTGLSLNKVKMEPTNWQSFLKALSNSENLNDIQITHSTVAQSPIEQGSANIRKTLDTFMLHHCRFKNTYVVIPCLPRITVLSICDIEMGPQYWIGFIESFIQFQSLYSVAISNCYIADGSIVSFPILKELKRLCLENIVMKPESWSNMFVSIRKSKHLHELRLYSCNSICMTADSSSSFDEIKKTIKIIDCDFQTADVYLPTTIKCETITVKKMVIAQGGWATLLKSLAAFKNISFLNIGECRITADQKHMSPDIPTSLKQIDLSYVSMQPENWEILFSSFAELDNLQYLEIKHCTDRVSENIRIPQYSSYFCQKQPSSNCCIRIQESTFKSSVQRALCFSLNELKMPKLVRIENGTCGNIDYLHINDCRTVIYEEGPSVISSSKDKISTSTEHITLQSCRNINNYQLEKQSNLTSLFVLTPSKYQMNILIRLLRNVTYLKTLALTGIVLKENIDLTNMTLLQHLRLDNIVMPGKSWSATLASINSMTNILSVSVSHATSKVKSDYTTRPDIFLSEPNSMTFFRGFEMVNCDFRDNEIQLFAIPNTHSVKFKQVYLNKISWRRLIPSLQTPEVSFESCNIEINETGLVDNGVLTSISLRKCTLSNSSMSMLFDSLCTKYVIGSLELTDINNSKTNYSHNYSDSKCKDEGKWSLKNCNLSNVVINEFPKYNHIKVVQIVNCKLTGAQWERFFNSMELLCFLHAISIENCLMDNCIPMFQMSCSVKCVTFINVKITSHFGWSKLISSSQNLTNLQQFYLLKCSHIKSKQATDRPATHFNIWAFVEPLTKFVIADSEFNANGINLPVNKTFSNLYIENVRMPDSGWENVINSIENVKQVKTFKFIQMYFKRANNATATACLSITVLELLTQFFARNFYESKYRYGVSISKSTIDKDAVQSLAKMFQEVSKLELHEVEIEQDDANRLMSEISNCKYLSKFVINSLSEIDARVDIGVYNFHGSIFVPPNMINVDRISVHGSFSNTLSVRHFLDNIFRHHSNVSYLKLHLQENGPVFQFPNDVAIESMTIYFEKCLKMPALNNLSNLQSLQIESIHFTKGPYMKSVLAFDWTVFVAEINELPSLHTLIFSDCTFPKKCELIPIEVKALTKLKYENPTSEDDFVDDTLFTPLIGLNTLCSVELINVKLSASSTIGLSLLKNLVSLSIVDCTFEYKTSRTEEQIFGSLIERGILEYLEVGWELLKAISPRSTDRKLKSLCLSGGTFTSENLNELDDVFIKYQAINSVFLGKCSFRNITLNLINLPNMTRLTLFDVKMNSVGWEVFCTNISNAQAIRSILILHCSCLSAQLGERNNITEPQVLLSNEWKQKYSKYNLKVDELSENGIVIVASNFDDSNIEIPRLSNIERVTLFKVEMVTSSWKSCLNSLSNIPSLHTVSFNYCSMLSFQSIYHKRMVISLQDNCLSISNCNFGKINFSFPQLCNFENVLIQFSDNDVMTDSCISSFKNLTSLKTITLKHQVLPNPTPKIPHLPSLEIVEFGHVTWNRKVDLSGEMMSLNNQCSLKPDKEQHHCGCISSLYSQ